MIQLTPQMRIMISVDSIDFRNGIDGLCRLCRQKMSADPFSGYVFVFCNRKKTSLKILTYDGQGFWMCQKRLSEGKFRWWPNQNSGAVSSLGASELMTLIWNGNPNDANYGAPWKEIKN